MISQTKDSESQTLHNKPMLSSKASKVLDPESYFIENNPPANLNQISEKTKNFIKINKEAGRKVVLVTSGGTTVPLENNTVRFIDNFSAGTRGSASAEMFIKKQHYSMPELGFLDFLNVDDSGNIHVKESLKKSLVQDIKTFNDAISDNRLIMPSFISLSDYLFALREITFQLSTLGPKSMFYLAAAVSDFFIPSKEMVEHKIQSSDGELSLKMNQVPKFLKPLLETDEKMLEPKARLSLEKYGHQAVVANMLHTRKQVVWIIQKEHIESAEEIRLTDEQIKKGVEIEDFLIERLVALHDKFISQNSS
ncbi:hypothetical protein BB559_006570 [Furculomyces boomerangus]|uniref:DNA/pantothenate metabolism flavoprotein C-terminal domain-containing protein n=1 Tax=Furculomyces boomerangus TaxID=61424 RepID=A0A2T9Y1Q5_9FUNG|nr:hypothetical protein BB559_006570 [Furculomyces boomerangus]